MPMLKALLGAACVATASAFMPATPASSFVGTAPARLAASSAVPRVAPVGAATLNMKVFDWKKREALAADPSLGELIPGEFGILGNLSPAPGSKPSKTRKGRGIAAGQGASCGFGMRGQKSRSGRPQRPGFEGGQMPLYRRLPKMVGKGMGRDGHQKANFGLLKLDVLNKCEPNSEVSYESCFEAGHMTKLRIKKGTSVIYGKQLVKVIGCNDAERNPVKLNVQVLFPRMRPPPRSASAPQQACAALCALQRPTKGVDARLDRPGTAGFGAGA